MPSSRKTRAPPDPFAKYINSGFSWFKNEKAQHPSDPRVFFKVYQFKCPCNDPNWSEWESPVSWDEDGMLCENPKCQDNGPILPYKAVISVTPCSFSKEKFFGKYLCYKCGRNWDSANAWSETFQKCEECIINVYPYDMSVEPYRLKPRGEKKPHPIDLCQKCQQINADCSKLQRVGGENGGRRFYRRRRNKKNKENRKPEEQTQVQETRVSQPEQGSGDSQKVGPKVVKLGEGLIADQKAEKARKKRKPRKKKTPTTLMGNSANANDPVALSQGLLLK